MQYFLTFKTILELKRYSKSTIETYLGFMKIFKETFEYNDYHIENLDDKDIILSIVSLVKKKNYAISSQKQLIGALNLFYKEVYKRHIDFSIIYPSRKTEYLPSVLSKKEVELFLKTIQNIKHKAVFTTIYGLGLRISEVVALKIIDIDSERMLVYINNSKGNKDRIIMLPEKVLLLLRDYFKAYKPKIYLFEGRNNAMYSVSSIRKTFHVNKQKAGILKPATVHTLRHSFATHLLENGTDIRIIQKLLGHNSIKTTLQYVKVAESTIQNVKSPIDTLTF